MASWDWARTSRLHGIGVDEVGGYSDDSPVSMHPRGLCGFHKVTPRVAREVLRGKSILFLGRVLHSSTFRLNVSAFFGTGGAFRGCYRGV